MNTAIDDESPIEREPPDVGGVVELSVARDSADDGDVQRGKRRRGVVERDPIAHAAYLMARSKALACQERIALGSKVTWR